jgi:hypothetical protein
MTTDPLRSPDGRFRSPTATERFARLAPRGGATGDLGWLDAALAPARRRAAALDGPVPPPEPGPPTPAPEPARPPGRIPAGPMGGSRASGDLIRMVLRRRR